MVVVALVVLAMVCTADVLPGYKLVGTDVTMKTLQTLSETHSTPLTLQSCADWCNKDADCVTITFTPTRICSRYYIRPCQTAPMVPAHGVVVFEKKASVEIPSNSTIISNALCASYVNGDELFRWESDLQESRMPASDINRQEEALLNNCKAVCSWTPKCQSYAIDKQYDEKMSKAILFCIGWSDSIYSGVGSKLIVEQCERRYLTYGLENRATSRLNCGK